MNLAPATSNLALTLIPAPPNQVLLGIIEMPIRYYIMLLDTRYWTALSFNAGASRLYFTPDPALTRACARAQRLCAGVASSNLEQPDLTLTLILTLNITVTVTLCLCAVVSCSNLEQLKEPLIMSASTAMTVFRKEVKG